MLENTYNKENDSAIYFLVTNLLLMQCFINIKPEKVKNIKFRVKTKKKKYDTIYEPVKRGNYYYIKIADENKAEIKQIQLPEKKVKKIEYIIENLKETKPQESPHADIE